MTIETVAISAHSGHDADGVRTVDDYARAVGTGAEYVEFDIRRTADGEFVAFHDPRTGRGDLLASISYRSLCDQAGYEVPRVADVMRAIAGRARGHLDLKDTGGESEVVRLAIEILGPDAFIVTTLEDSSAAAVRAAFPSLPVALSLGRDVRLATPCRWLRIRASELRPMRRITACGADWVAVNYKLAAAGVLAQCHENRIKAMIWTVNEDNAMRRWLADPRVSVLITDRPARAAELREAARCERRPETTG